ncbi:MAG TPA: sugar phosphate nucleotidyltransferase [Candidatus Saccharimonadales bacterium]|nr:sugar phosphate nucleotidyltransferase [Candidatus Saccharimonadales bacterium]
MSDVRKAVIAAAGFGTRFLPQTKAMPKEMLPIVDKPIIQYVVEELVEAGITDIIIVTGQAKRSIEDHFDVPTGDLIANLQMGGEKKRHFIEEVEDIADLANFVFVRQQKLYGNGVPLLDVEHLIGDEPFIYTWSDDFIVSEPVRFKQLCDLYEEHGTSVLACVRALFEDDFKKYGFVGGNEIAPGLLEAKDILEKPGSRAESPSDLAMVSGFLFTPEIFGYLHRVKDTLEEGAELWYNDALKLMLADHKKILAAEIKNGRYYDAGDKLEYIKTVVDFALKRNDIGEPLRAYLQHKLSE